MNARTRSLVAHTSQLPRSSKGLARTLEGAPRRAKGFLTLCSNTVLDASVTLTSPAVLFISSILKAPTTVLFPPFRLTQENVRSFNILHNHKMASLYVPPEYNIDTQHNGTEHLAINNTFIRRLLSRLALHTTAKFYPDDGLCTPISKHKIIKTGRRTHLTEGATMRYLSEQTTIPIPKVYCSFLHKNRAYIVMERIQGEELPKVWKSMSEESKEDIFTQLRGIFQELRSLTPSPGTGVESCVGGSLYDSRIPRGNPRFGPFKKIQDFHFWLRRDLKLEDLKDQEKDQEKDQSWHDLQEMINKQDGPWPPPKFTHGDINPFNILVREGKVVGIIDWEFSGWYPHYWEYTSAWFGNVTRTDWQDVLVKFLNQPHPDEFKMEEVRNKWWGE